jgi:hypothetical protein
MEEVDPIRPRGLVFKVEAANTDRILSKLNSMFRGKGYTILALEKNFGIKKRPDIMGILATTDKYEILTQIKTDGIHYKIDNDSLLKIIHAFDEKYGLDLMGAGGDWCEFAINKVPEDWQAIAQEVNAVCPDVVKQGTGTVKALAREMKKTKRLYFWWK